MAVSDAALMSGNETDSYSDERIASSSKEASKGRTVREQLHYYAKTAPKTSGVYLWRDEKDCIIYVGKAKSLKNRLTSYFAAHRDIKTRILVSRARKLEYIQTANEYEALLLENNLIKKYKPRYNINLKDGKTYPVLKITHEPFPRLYRTRSIRNDGARYFGPFPNVTALDNFLNLVKRHYSLRQCKRLKKGDPCLYYHIGRCTAPCAGQISEQEYRKEIDEIIFLLEGDIEQSVAGLTEKMKAAAAAREFEKAACLRDGIQALYTLRGQNIVEDMDPEARDYIAWASEAALITFTVLKMRGGKVVGRDLYRTESLKDEEEVLLEFLMAYYTDARQIPPHLFVPSRQGHELARRWFSEQFGTDVTITMIPLEAPKSGNTGPECAVSTGSSALSAIPADEDTAADEETAAETAPSYTASQVYTEHQTYELPVSDIQHHRAALTMAQFNAKEDAARRLKEHGDFPALEELQKLLGLQKPPHRIEGFDIAHLHGQHTVASLISFSGGNPDKKNYRIYRLRTTAGIIDDYASMREVVARRYTRLLNEGADLPDLILIDGGLGQVNAAKTILDALALDIPMIGLAEKNEEIYLPHTPQPLVLPRRSPALRLLQRVRDETHRFANTHNNRLRTKAALSLSFEQLPHTGKKRAAMLLKRFTSLEAAANADPEIIASILSISPIQAAEIVKAAQQLCRSVSV